MVALWPWAIVAAVVLWLLYWIPARKLPLPTPHYQFFLGTLLYVVKIRDRYHDFFTEQTFKYRTTWASYILDRCQVNLVDDERNMKHILRDNFENYEKSPYQKEVFRELMGDGIFNVDGQEWRSQRKVALNLFTTGQLRDVMHPVFLKHGRKLVNYLDRVKPGQEVDIQDLFFRFTLDSFCEVAFGEDLNSLEQQNEFAVAFDRVQAQVNPRFYFPWWKILRWLRVERERQISVDINTIDDFAHGMIERRRREVVSSHIQRPDLITYFLRHAEKTGVDVSDKFLRDLIVNFIIAGRDTTAVALSWVFYELSRLPDIEANVIDEVDKLVKEHGEVNYDLAQHMEYADAVLHESIRLHPSVPIDIKHAVGADTLPDGTFVPAGAVVAYSPYMFGRSERLWPDPLKIDPSRWMGEARKEHSQFKFIAFNAGPRLCLGMNLAIIEAKTMMALILQKFRLRVAADQDPTYRITITLPFLHGLRVTVEHRE